MIKPSLSLRLKVFLLTAVLRLITKLFSWLLRRATKVPQATAKAAHNPHGDARIIDGEFRRLDSGKLR